MAPTASGLVEEAPAKINYRAVGRGSGGVVKKRIPVFIKGVDRPSPSSVPTKYETVLLDQNREKRGFNSYTPRFTEARWTGEVPGPGAYAGESEAGIDAFDRPMSARANSEGPAPRGKGPFASRTPRLPHAAGYVPPGPGTYEADIADPKPTPASADFALPGPGNPANYESRSDPGPGYFLGTMGGVPPLGWSAPAHPFTSAKRSSFEPVQDTPGPGTYSIEAHHASQKLSSTHGKFASSRRKLVPAYEKKTSDEKCTSDFALRKKGAELMQTMSGEQRTSKDVPGPGMYTPRAEAVKGQSQFGTKGHSSFQLGSSHIPRSWRPSSPGPGQYDAQEVQPKASAPLSTMASHTNRFRRAKPAAPGPAYYSPRKATGKVSFHLNFQNSWL
eukprot:TRINITY_DN25511_c1_g2_i1.p1 TRINITY_DN25511_c1_g2~~TRINITY_DN25511_c1_g2_i1.p1  ORF type:complete len:388 (+),score=34.90 TRINITY_DN25511_c1_g2_i1:110-1273(+)